MEVAELDSDLYSATLPHIRGRSLKQKLMAGSHNCHKELHFRCDRVPDTFKLNLTLPDLGWNSLQPKIMTGSHQLSQKRSILDVAGSLSHLKWTLLRLRRILLHLRLSSL